MVFPSIVCKTIVVNIVGVVDEGVRFPDCTLLVRKFTSVDACLSSKIRWERNPYVSLVCFFRV